MRELPKLYMIIKCDRGFIVNKGSQGKIFLLRLEYEPYSDDFYEIIWQHLYNLIGVTDFYLSELGTYEINNNDRFRIIIVKIREMDDLYKHAKSQFLPDGLAVLSKEEMN